MTGPVMRAVVDDLSRGITKQRVASNFHAGVAEGFVQAALRARETTGIIQVAISGGCLHNRKLSALLRTRLQAEGICVYMHRHVSPGDGGLSYGQAAIAAAMLQR
jgi:hydrogenase maturation protein HypF